MKHINLKTVVAGFIAVALLATMLFASFFPACSGPSAVPLKNEEELKKMAAGFMTALGTGRYDDASKMFDNRMASAVPTSELAELWAEITLQTGAWQGITDTIYSEESSLRVVYVVSDFENGSLDFQLVFDNDAKIVGMWLGTFVSGQYNPPDYALEDEFTEIEVIVGEGKWSLPGTLSMPLSASAGQKVPAVVLVHGSGPSDRDESIGPNKPFKDLAWGLASKGIAVLRYEKRTKAHGAEFAQGTEIGASFTVMEETIEDAVLAIELLKNIEGIDADKVFIVGHSFGASVGPRIVLECGDLQPAGLIMMAGASGNLADLIPEQLEYLANLDGEVDEDELAEINEAKAAAEKIRSGGLNVGETAFGAPKSYWDDLVAYNQVETARQLDLPIFVMQGERDYQVTAAELERWEQALLDKPNVTIKTYPDLNHLFMSGSGMSSPDEYAVPSNVSKKAVDDISEWIERVTRP